jgi:hypothetical protein
VRAARGLRDMAVGRPTLDRAADQPVAHSPAVLRSIGALSLLCDVGLLDSVGAHQLAGGTCLTHGTLSFLLRLCTPQLAAPATWRDNSSSEQGMACK